MSKHRKIQLAARTLSFWCVFLVPVLWFWGWIFQNPQLVGYLVLPFVAVVVFFFREVLPIKLLSKQKLEQLKQHEIMLASLKYHITVADNAISAGNVLLWLNCFVEHVHWIAFDKPTFTYVVIQLKVLSRFIYDLMFLNPNQVAITLIVKGATENNDIKVVDKAMLVESQSTWNIIEPPIIRDSTGKIQALFPNSKYFRFEIKDAGVRDRIEALHNGKSEIQLELKLDWKLKVPHNNKELIYHEELKATCPMKWNS